MSDDEGQICTDLGSVGGDRPGNVLWISYTKSPDEQLRRWRSNGGCEPANIGIVSVGDTTRSAAAAGGGSGPANGRPIESVSNPNDLTGLGIAINKYLERWRDEDGPTTVCFDSLTALLQYADLETAYEFLHILVGRVYAADATIHFHMDPGAHDDETVESVVSLVDAVIELSFDGDPDVRTR